MDAGTAVLILEVAKSGGFLDEDIPSDEKEQLELGKWWLEQAVKAAEGGMADNDAVRQIIELGKNGDGAVEEAAPMPDDQLAEAEEQAVAEAISAGEEMDRDQDLPEEPDVEEPVGSPQQESSGEPPVTVPDRNHGHPVPPAVQGEVMPMPRDLTSLDDRQVRRLMGEYNALFARVTWETAIEGADLTNSEHMMEHSLRVARRKVARVDVGGRKLNAEDVNDEARMDPEFQQWEHRYLEHDRRFRELRALKDIYEGHLERLSREASIRDQEFKRST